MAVSGLSCGTQDLHWGMQDLSLQHTGSSLLFTGFSLVVAWGFSLSSCGMRVPEHVGSLVEARGLSCPVACGILVPWPGIEPPAPALEGGFFTTGPPRKSQAAGVSIPLAVWEKHLVIVRCIWGGVKETEITDAPKLSFCQQFQVLFTLISDCN